jgi:predicted house-cleaning noncanonical NTP pyrophosphatase (MazG superfamily)
LPTAPLYVLSDQAIVARLARGDIPTDLRSDVEALVGGSLVIRMDLATDDLHAKQLLPRTQEMRDASVAIQWLVEQSRQFSGRKEHSAFIFHNFIPAQAAAFAYAHPNQPLVQIEALWGLPEGLYYNSHDQYVVDTRVIDPALLVSAKLDRLPVRGKPHYKRNFVSTTESGAWETLPVLPPYDWRSTLSEGSCRRIAIESRRIAAAENRAVSVMWFSGVPKSAAPSSAIPWYHEQFDLSAHGAAITGRVKTSFDKCFVVQSEQDIALLQAGESEGKAMSRIRVQPSDETLLRDKLTLRKIGEAAKAMGATIVLEGAVLSHAYYQLLSTGAIVEVVHPFLGFEEAVTYNKLVRDKVPDIVRTRGESVKTTRLDDESLVRALREKLVEEAFEALDAKDCESIIAELADVKEVVESLLMNLRVGISDLEKEQARKREERGGFRAGLVLVETRSELPTSKVASADHPQLLGIQLENQSERTLTEAELRRRSETPDKRLDRRVTAGKVELQVNVSVPVTGGPWHAETAEERVVGANGKIVSGRVKGTRKGAQLTVEMAVRIDQTQPELI